MKNSLLFKKTLASASMLALTLTMSVPAAFADQATTTPTGTASSTPTIQTLPPVLVVQSASSTASTTMQTSSSTTSTATMPTASTTPSTTRPTGLFSSAATFHTGDNPIPFSVIFSQPITGLLGSFFNVGNGTVSNFATVSGLLYTFDVTPAAPSGTVSVDLNGDKVKDFAGNFNVALPQIQRIIDPSLPNNYLVDGGHATGTTTATTTSTGGNNGTASSTTATTTTSTSSNTATITGGPADGSSTASTTISFTFTVPTNATVRCTFGSVTNAYLCGSPQTFTGLPEGTYTFKIVATAPSFATTSDMRTFTIDRTAPTISEVSPIASSTSATPTYMFTSNERGSITYGGSCSSATLMAVSGVNTITLNTLANGNYANCTITVRDAAGNASRALPITSFTVTAPIVLQAGSNSGDTTNSPTSGGGRSGGGSRNVTINSPVTTVTTDSGGNSGGGSGTTNPSFRSGSVGTNTTGGNRFTGVGGGTDTSNPGSVLGTATVAGSIDTGSTTATDASTSSSTLATGVDGSQTAAAGLAQVPAILWGLLILLILAIIGGTWYYRRETRY